MQAFQLKIIESVAPETLFEKFKTAYKTYQIPQEVGLTPKVIANYDQAKNNYCTAFGSAGCTTCNTWKLFTNEYITEWASKYIQPWGLASMMVISEKFAKEHGYRSKPINIDSIEAKTLLDAGYALVVSLTAPSEFWTQGTKTGKAVGLFSWKPFTHTVYLERNKGRDYLQNSWGSLIAVGLWNQIHVELPDLLKNKYIRPLSVVIY